MEVPARLLFVSALIALSHIAPQAAQQPASATTIEFQDISFELSGTGWVRSDDGRQITLKRSERRGYSQNLSIWSVQVPDGLRGTNAVAHTSGYFNFERRQQRPKESRWKNFMEATRTLDGVRYSIMSFDVSGKQDESSGLFLLYFPTDFSERQTFYCFMYNEVYPAREKAPPIDLTALDRAVSTVRLQPPAVAPPAVANENGFAKMLAGDLDGALVDYTRAIERDPQNAALYVMRADVKEGKRDLDGAIADYTLALAIMPRNGLAYQARGGAKAKKGDADGAIADFTSALAADPNMYWVLTERGRAKGQKGDLDGAIADLTAALDRGPGDDLARVTRGFLKRRKGDLRGAIADFTGSIKQFPDGPDSYSYRAYAEYDMGVWKDALADFRKVSELAAAREQVYARLRIWLLRARLGDVQAASRELTTFLTSWRTGDVDPWLAILGRFLTGEVSEPELFEAANSTDEKQARERKCEAYFYAGSRRLVAGDTATARTYFQQAVDTGVTTFTEYISARAELDTMRKRQR